LLLPAGRHLVFARPGRLVVLDLWACAGLALHGPEPAPGTNDLAGLKLAARPVPLGGHHLGLLLVDSNGSYRWQVRDLERRDGPAAGDQADALELKIEGTPCRVELVDGRAVVLATPLGHWVWDAAAAARGEVGACAPTWPDRKGPAERRVELDVQAVDPKRLRQPSMGWRVNEPGISDNFDWYYRVEGRRTSGSLSKWAEHYTINFASRTPTVVPSPLEDARLVPLGPIAVRSRSTEFVLKAGTSLMRTTDSRVLEPCAHNLPEPLYGLQLFGSNALAVTQGADGKTELEAASLQHAGLPARARLDGRLVADPLLWSHWLFTVEIERAGRAVVRRRELIEGGSERDGSPKEVTR
jgi:hypothetical protein